jgi:Tol biopolymer transport system component
MFSPDGRWIAYRCDESGIYQVYVQAFPDKHGRRQISDEAGANPSWPRNGEELFFWSRGRLMVAAFKSRGDSFVTDKPRVWSEKRPVTFTSTRSYDPAPDGKRVVALMPAETPDEPTGHWIFLLNLFDELRRRASLEPR